jgi:hypothetical protein
MVGEGQVKELVAKIRAQAVKRNLYNLNINQDLLFKTGDLEQ